MDIAQMDETEKLPARGLPNWAWFFISFVVARVQGGFREWNWLGSSQKLATLM